MFFWKSRYLILGLTLLLISTGCGGTQGGVGEGVSPAKTAPSPTVDPAPMPTQGEIGQAPGIREARMLSLEWPPKIRAGDSDVIRLTLEVDDLGNMTPTAEIAGHESRGEIVFIPNIYETHHVIASARLDIAGLQIIPNDLIEQPLLPGESIDYYWSVMTDRIGTFRGTVWLYLRFLPLDGGEETQKPLTAQVIEIKSVNLLGLGGTPARLLGSLGIVVSGLLGMDDILSLLKKGYQFLKKGA
jgi:hypothetical protein